MHILPKLFGVLLLWGVVAYIIFFIDPSLLKNVWLPGLYLPFVLAVGAAAWYTFALFARRGWGAFALAFLVMGFFVLTFLHLMYPILGLVIVFLALFIAYLTFIH